MYKELETGCLRAVPDNDLAAKEMIDFFKLPKEMRKQIGLDTRRAFEKHYQWDMSGKKWEDYFDSVEVEGEAGAWKSPLRINQPEDKPEKFPEGWGPDQISRWLITNVLGEPERINTMFGARLARDLTYQTSTSFTGGMYFNESSAAFDGIKHRQPFSVNDAYNQMRNLANRRNHWEQERAKVLGS